MRFFLLPLALVLGLSTALPQGRGKAVTREPYWDNFDPYRDFCRDPRNRDEYQCLDRNIPTYPRPPARNNNPPTPRTPQQRYQCEERCLRDTQTPQVSSTLLYSFVFSFW